MSGQRDDLARVLGEAREHDLLSDPKAMTCTVAAVERIVFRHVRAVEEGRDAEIAEADREMEKTLAIMEAACDRADRWQARAESAEAEAANLRAELEVLRGKVRAVEGLARKVIEVHAHVVMDTPKDRELHDRAVATFRAYLDAALTTPPAVQGEGEVGARVLREASLDIDVPIRGTIDGVRVVRLLDVTMWLRDRANARADSLASDAGREG